MPGIRTNQLADDAVTSAKIAALDGVLAYDGTVSSGSLTANDAIPHVARVQEMITANIEGLDVKDSVRACTTANLWASQSGTGVGATLTSLDSTFLDLTIDGVAVANNDRVLVKNMGGAVFSIGAFPADDGAGNYRFTDTGEFGKFFEFLLPDGLTGYYVWFNDGSASDPSGAATGSNQPTAGYTGLQATFAASSAGSVVAGAALTAIDGAALGEISETQAPSTTLYIVFATQTSGNDNTTVTNGPNLGALPTVTVTTELAADADASLGKRNGIYTYADTNSNTQAWVMTRATDFDEDSEVTSSAFTFVEEGTTCAGTGWVLNTSDPITVDTTAQSWAQFSTQGSFTAGTGIDITGSVVSVKYDDSTVGVNGSEQLVVKDQGLTGAKLSNSAFNGGFAGGLFLDDGPTDVTYTNATTPKPQFAASLALTGSVTGTFQHGETITGGTGGFTGYFMGFDDQTTPTVIFYLPLDGLSPVALETITGSTSSATVTVNATPADTRTNSPDGTTTAFDLSIATYNAQETGSAAIVTGSLEVYRNGVLQKPVLDNTGLAGRAGTDLYYYAGGQITFSVAPAYGEEIFARYIANEVGA